MYRDMFLREMLRYDGRGDALLKPECRVCNKREGIFRCLDCFGERLFCGACIASLHMDNPFHRIKVSELG